MNKDLLQLFYQDEHTRNAVKQFQVALLEEMAVKDTFDNGGENAKAIQQAKKLVDASYKRLDDVFGEPEQPTKYDPR